MEYGCPMSNVAYSALKAAWHTDKIDKMRLGEQIVPVGVQLILSDFCNHDCHFCAYRASNGLSVEQFKGPDKSGAISHNPLRMMTEDKASEIINDCSGLGVKSITFTGGGEPTVHPQHLEMFALAMDLGMDASLNTNGNILRKGWQDVIPRMKYARFSIDAGTAEEYAQIRGVPETTYEKVLGNLRLVASECDETVVGTGYVVTPENWVNLDTGVRRIKETGATYVRLASMQSTEQNAAYPEDTWAKASEACQQAVSDHADDNFSVVNLFDGVMGVQPSDPFCGFQQFVTYLGADLKVYRCCYTAYTGLGEIGDLREQSYAEWFYSQQKKDAIGCFDARSCAICPLEPKNKTINYMLDGDPMHVNFV